MQHLKFKVLRQSLFFLLVILWSVPGFAQRTDYPVSSPQEKDVSWILSFLSSDWLEGRETGTEGNQLAGDFIANIMKMNGLQPYGDILQKDHAGTGQEERGWFQEFNVIRYQAAKSELSIISAYRDENPPVFTPKDYVCYPPPFSMLMTSDLVFGGYGLQSGDEGYNDFKGIQTKDHILIALDSYPGHLDTNSKAWKNYGKSWEESGYDPDTKLKIAQKSGAKALIILRISEDTTNTEDPEYRDASWMNEHDSSAAAIPMYILNPRASRILLAVCQLDLTKLEKSAANLVSPSCSLPGYQAKASIDVQTELVPVRNVVGIIRSDNPAGTILLGAHYDHLGKRNQTIYNGADDNASGVAGLLGLAKVWGRATTKLPCNLVFAAWTGEEKGLLGSEYFVQNRKPDPDDYLLAVNMDMISRSAPEDTAGRIVSVGTLPAGENLRQIAREANLKNNLQFNLDLWDVTGHTGSDYASFTAAGIQVMTFFSGFHKDYHSERDDADKADLQKMGKILNLVNGIIRQVISTIR